MSKKLIGIFKRKRIVIPILFAFTALVIWAGYQILWTGFSQQSLWDWMQLLIIPIVLGIGALLFQREESKVERENTLDKQRQETLMTYFDRMETLLLQRGLRESKEGSEVRTVARARTLAVLWNLDWLRKRYALQFLYESDLVNHKNPIVKLNGANLYEANLDGAYLYEANLEGAHLEEAHLEGAHLEGAHLSRAKLMEAHLEGAHLYEANLYEANLEGAHLEGACLFRANLNWANLNKADLKLEQLDQASEFLYAIMPDGTRYMDWIKKGMPDWSQS